MLFLLCIAAGDLWKHLPSVRMSYGEELPLNGNTTNSHTNLKQCFTFYVFMHLERTQEPLHWECSQTSCVHFYVFSLGELRNNSVKNILVFES